MFRRVLKAATVLVAVVFLAAACSSDGFPVSYSDQVDEETGLSNVENNWLEGCTAALTENLAEDANNVCQCSYDRISGPDGIPFEEFVQLDDDLRDDPQSLSGEGENAPEGAALDLLNHVQTCIAG